MEKLVLEAGLEPVMTYHGHWCGRPIRHSYQDVVVLAPQPKLPVDFDPLNYLRLNPDLDTSSVQNKTEAACSHYLQHGIAEGRKWT